MIGFGTFSLSYWFFDESNLKCSLHMNIHGSYNISFVIFN